MNIKYLILAFAIGQSTNVFAQDLSVPNDSEQFMVVLDASGSMWGQIEGRTKIDIVRDAYGKMVKTWDDRPIESGLIAYGHRRKGDCSDIELLSKVGQSDSKSLGRAVHKLTPKGKTPLGAAVRLAAEELKYTEKKATVILLSDGIETCGVDPCQLGLDLESLGVDFTAHVVGLDIKSDEDKTQLQCLAENTGGQFLTAQTADQLDDALLSTTQPLKGLKFQGLLADTGEPASYMIWEVSDPLGKLTFETNSATLNLSDFPEGGLGDGDYTITGRAENYTGSTQFSLPSKKPIIHVRLFPDIPTTTLTPVSEIYAGNEFGLEWVGEGYKEDRIAIVPVGGDASSALDIVKITSGHIVTLKAPHQPGLYEVIYLNNAYENNRVDARQPITVAETPYVLDVEGGVIRAGQSFTISWRGPGLDADMIAIGPRTSGSDDYTSLSWIENAPRVTLTAPDIAGEYELRYYGDGYVLQYVQPVLVQ